jgi:hypothetical protein
MKKIICLMFLLLINTAIAEIFEYDDVVFYPNNSQTINISKLYINMTDNSLIKTYIFYKNKTYVLEDFGINKTLDLPINKFNISVNISAIKVSESKWNVYYTVKNDYNHDIPVNISFPKGYDLNNVYIVVPGKSSKTIVLHKESSSDTLYFKESNISFIIPSKIKLRYSLSIPFSIEKSNDVLNNGTEVWHANYSIYNNKNISLKLNGTIWAVEGNKTVILGNFSNIFLNPNSTFKLSRSIYYDNVPTFYIKFYNWNDSYIDITIKPALKENNSYIMGIARVKGCNLTYHYVSPTSHTENNNPHPTNHETNNNENNNPSSENSGSTSNSNNHLENEGHAPTEEYHVGDEEGGSPVSNIANSITEKAKEYLLKPYSKENDVWGVKIRKLENAKDAEAISIPISLLSMLFIPFLYLNIHPDVLDGGELTPYLCRLLGRNVYIPYGVKLGKIIPLNITLISPNKYLVSEIFESFDIPLNSAKSLAVAIEYGGKIITSDKKTYEIAKKIGINAIYIGGELHDKDMF